MTSSSTQSENQQSYGWVENDMFCKMSKDINDVTKNECEIGKQLNHPNVVRFIKQGEKWGPAIRVHEKSLTEAIPSIPKVISYWEKLDGISLSDFIDDKIYDDLVVINCIKQVMYTILELQQKFKFVHGDLHTNNIIVCRTNKPTLKYIVGNFTVVVNTFGYIAKIIDFGNAVIFDNHKIQFVETPLYAMDKRFANVFYDPFFDFKIFLKFVCDEWMTSRAGNLLLKFLLMRKNIFYMRDHDEDMIDHDGGDVNDAYFKFSARLIELNDEQENKLAIIQNTKMTCTDILLGLAQMPIKPQVDDSIVADTEQFFDSHGLLAKFFKIWSDVEKYFTIDQSLYFLKETIDFCRSHANEDGHHVEGLYTSFVSTILDKFEIKNISIDHLTCAKIFNILVAMITPISNFLTIELAGFILSIQSYNETKIEYLEKEGSRIAAMTHYEAFARLIAEL